jgi:ABC-type multidrug transport system fused ATPase/permease subunit
MRMLLTDLVAIFVII